MIKVFLHGPAGPSPAALGLMLHIDKQGIIEARFLVLESAAFFGEVLLMVPHDYIETVREPFQKLSHTALKLVSVKEALNNLNRHI